MTRIDCLTDLHHVFILATAFLVTVSMTTLVHAAETLPYQQQKNVVYGEAHGVGLALVATWMI